MLLKIDVEKSIEKKKIIPSSRTSYLADYLFYGSIALIFIIAFVVKLFQSLINQTDGDILIIFIIILAVFPLTLINLLNMTKLKVLDINDKLKTKQHIHKLISKNNWNIHKDTDETLIIETALTFPRERQVTFIIKDKVLYINTMTFGKGIRSTLYYNSDKQFSESIIEELKEKINT